jgi:hypothetical protein
VVKPLLLRSSWLRLTRWEYWPPWLTYVPVVGYVAMLAVKHRSATVFTAANPAILAGGFIGESKIDILEGLGQSHSSVARSEFIDRRLSIEARIAATLAFLERERLSLPIVLKPDQGQRGSGVVVARTREELIRSVARSRVDTILQEYVPGLEFGVFYYRHPLEARGHILSITEKQLPVVVGDGRRTLEQLILDGDRTRGMARFHLERQAARLHDVPSDGEQVSLGDCGSHCRGATFLDGRAMLTSALEDAFDRIGRAYEGFYFGRFDVRVGSVDELQEGRGFKIIELNGVTSEATHIYDPGVGLFEAYRVLFKQWRLAFAIGAVNAARGAKVSSLRELVRLTARYQQESRGHLRDTALRSQWSAASESTAPGRGSSSPQAASMA